METISLDQPTLRIHLDRLTQDKAGLTARLNEEVAKLEALKNGIEQYRGALSYNQNLIELVTKQLEELNKAAFSAQAKSLKEVLDEKTLAAAKPVTSP